jgi:hypothetical protein
MRPGQVAPLWKSPYNPRLRQKPPYIEGRRLALIGTSVRRVPWTHTLALPYRTRRA